MASVVTDLDNLCIEQMSRRYQPGLRLAAHCPTTPATIHSPDDLEQCHRIGFPPIREKERELPGARDEEPGGGLWRRRNRQGRPDEAVDG